MIRFDNVTKRYASGQDALREVGFSIEAGEFVFLTGHSGAGKSTVLKLISAQERPTRGTVLLDGKNVGAVKPRAIPAVRRLIGQVFQDHRLLADRTAFDNVALPLVIASTPRAEIDRRVRAALDKVGLGSREKALPVMLSGGEQQRLAIARAVVNRPNLVLADEPTAHLDREAATDVARIFHEFHQVGVTLLIATYADDLFPGARRLRLDHGSLQP